MPHTVSVQRQLAHMAQPTWVDVPVEPVEFDDLAEGDLITSPYGPHVWRIDALAAYRLLGRSWYDLDLVLIATDPDCPDECRWGAPSYITLTSDTNRRLWRPIST